MELGAGKRFILLTCLFIQSMLFGESWQVGVIPPDPTLLAELEHRLISEEFVRRSRDYFSQSLLRKMESSHMQRYLQSLILSQEISILKKHHQETLRYNEQFFIDQEMTRKPISIEIPPPEVEQNQIPADIRFLDDYTWELQEDLRGLHLITLDEKLDELVIIDLFEHESLLYMSHYSYLIGAETLHILASQVIEPGSPVEPFTLPGFIQSKKPHKGTESLQLDTLPLIRTIPSGASLIGTGSLYGVIREGYEHQYLLSGGNGELQELLLIPNWVNTIDSQRMRADRFYRSLAGFMLSLPLTIITADMTDTDGGTLMFHAAAALNITAAVSTLIDLFKYTNYLLY